MVVFLMRTHTHAHTYTHTQGVGPTAQRAAVLAGVLLPSYDFFKKALLDSSFMSDNMTTHFTYVTDVCCCLVVVCLFTFVDTSNSGFLLHQSGIIHPSLTGQVSWQV